MFNPRAKTIEELVMKIVSNSATKDAEFSQRLTDELARSTNATLPSLSVTEAHTIAAIGEDPAISASSIASTLGMTRGGVSKILSRLEAKGYVKAESRDDNCKERKLSLTEQGQLAFEAHAKLHQQKSARLLGLLDKYTDEELDVLIRMLSDLVESESL